MQFGFFLSSNNTGSSSHKAADSLASANHNTETAGSIAFLSGRVNDGFGGFDAFGGKDLFGSPDCANINTSFFANAGNVETAGSVACADFSSVSSFADGGAACASVGSDGGSCSSSCSSFVC